MIESNRKKIREVIADFEKSEDNVVAIDAIKFPKKINAYLSAQKTEIVGLLQQAIELINQTREFVFQRALEEVSEKKMLDTYQQLNGVFETPNGKDLQPQSWAEAVIMVHELQNYLDETEPTSTTDDLQ
jgi:uncharacterized protein YqgV (UPF0045/DUF77 family)